MNQPIKKNVARQLAIKGHRRQSELERKDTFRSVITRGRHLDQLDWSQLPVKSSTTLMDTDGLFWFIPGFSIVGGGDKVRP